MKAIAVALAAMAVAPTTGIEIDVRVERFFPPDELGGSELILIAERADSQDRVPIEITTAVWGLQTISLPSGGLWSLSCRNERLWCPRLTVGSERDEPGYLPVFEKVRVQGWLHESESRESPKSVTVQGWLRLTAISEPLASFSADVPVGTDGRFGLDVPAGKLDLRLAAVGTAPAYRWGYEAKGPTSNLGRIRLRPGGSVAGFAVDGADDRPAADVHVVAEPSGSVPTSILERMHQARSRATTNARGFFQLTGLAPGEYRLVLSAPGFAQRVAGPVEIATESETLLEHAIELIPPVTLGLEIAPPRTPDDRRWILELAPDRSIANSAAPERKRASANGEVVFTSLDPGHYRVRVLDEERARLLERRLLVDSDRFVELEVPLIEVVGHVFLNDEPLGARIELSAGEHDETVLHSDRESGVIQGWMRTPSLSLLHVEITAEDPPIKRSFVVRNPTVRERTLELEIELEGIDVSGVVVDAEDRPVTGAKIDATAASGDRSRATSDQEGAFTLYALAPGASTFGARHKRRGKSGSVTLDLSADSTPPAVRLVLIAREEIHGRLLDATGAPVPGAVITVLTVGPAPDSTRQPTSLDGTFTLSVAKGATHGIFAVSAPGHVLWSTCQALGDGEPSVLRLPPSPGGQLHLTLPPDDPQDPPRGPYALLSSTGGMISLNTLNNWSRAMGTGGAAVDASGITSIVVPRLAAERGYAPIRTLDFDALAREICLAGPPADLDWRYLPVAGEVSLGSDSGAR